ncbi:uncharacterized protein LOC135493735 [Lineus longissimus]|uniref:uncharacterized protein LOC135493735 n=1 Tax=Lineus longissimus TaxID=88925 RepID=UPI002B4C90D3
MSLLSLVMEWMIVLLCGCLQFYISDACVNRQDENMPYGGVISVENYPEGVTNLFRCNWYIYRQDGYKKLAVTLKHIEFVGESRLIIHTAKPSEHSTETLVFETTTNQMGNETFVTDAPYFYFEIRTTRGTVTEFAVQYLSYNEPNSGVCPVSSQSHVNSDDFLCNDNKYCINKGLKCNGDQNCLDDSDEGSVCRNNIAVVIGVILGIIIGALVILLTTYLLIRYHQQKHPDSFFRDPFGYEPHRNEPSAHFSAGAGNQNGIARQTDPPVVVVGEISPTIQV